MTKPNQALLKTCISCGQQKPLSAFLQFSGQLGSTYGNVCASCRKTTLEKPAPKEPEESTRSDSGFNLGSKAKVAGDRDKQQIRQQREELNLEEKEVKEEQ